MLFFEKISNYSKWISFTRYVTKTFQSVLINHNKLLKCFLDNTKIQETKILHLIYSNILLINLLIYMILFLSQHSLIEYTYESTIYHNG